MTTKVFDNIVMLRFGKTNLAKNLNIWNADVDNIVISKLIEKKKE